MLKNLLNQSITIYSKSGLDKFGRESFGSGSSAKARFQAKTVTRLLPNQETVTIEGFMWVLPSVTIARGDKVVFGGNSYKVFARYEGIDGAGNTHHIKLELTKWQLT